MNYNQNVRNYVRVGVFLQQYSVSMQREFKRLVLSFQQDNIYFTISVSFHKDILKRIAERKRKLPWNWISTMSYSQLLNDSILGYGLPDQVW